MRLWIDDIRPSPDFMNYIIVHSVNEAKNIILLHETMNDKFELIDIDHDAGDYASDGGDYIKLLDWLEITNRDYLIHIHSMNPVGVQNMRAIIQKNGWKEI